MNRPPELRSCQFTLGTVSHDKVVLESVDVSFSNTTQPPPLPRSILGKKISWIISLHVCPYSSRSGPRSRNSDSEECELVYLDQVQI